MIKDTAHSMAPSCTRLVVVVEGEDCVASPGTHFCAASVSGAETRHPSLSEDEATTVASFFPVT